MKQTDLGLHLSTKRKREFLDEMNRVVPWADLVTRRCHVVDCRAHEGHAGDGSERSRRILGEAGEFANTIRAAHAKVVIPPGSNRKTKRRYSSVLYRTRNIVERFFNRIKHSRRVATRYDKLADNYLAFAALACAFGPPVTM